MKRKLTQSLSIVCLPLLILTACTETAQQETTDQSIRPARVMKVSLQNAQQQMQLVGRVEPAQSIDLAFEVSGPLQALAIREGAEVKKGDVLASLDPVDFQLDVREAQVQLRLAQQDLDRKERVLAQRGIARSTVDDARSVRDLQSVRLTQTRQKLADARLQAPFDGRIAQRFVDGFTNVNVAQPILRLHSSDELYVVANIPEQLSATLTPEDIERVYCRFSFSGTEEFPLTFAESRGEADGIAQTIEISFAMAASKNWNLLPGMTAMVTLEMKQSALTSVLVPTAAVVADAEQQFFVWLLDEANNTVTRRYIRIGNSTPKGLVVLEGLSNDDVIVTTGAATLSEGIRVRPMTATERV